MKRLIFMCILVMIGDVIKDVDGDVKKDMDGDIIGVVVILKVFLNCIFWIYLLN